jgi:hypothetical protein
MHDEDVETEGDDYMDEAEQSECPMCGSNDECHHLFACIDRTFGEWQGGYAYDRSDDFAAAVRETFERRLRSGVGTHPNWADDDLRQLWEYAEEHNVEGEAIEVDNDALIRLLGEIFVEAGAVEIDAVWGDDMPGYTSAVSSFYAEDPAAVFDQSLRRLKERLES